MLTMKQLLILFMICLLSPVFGQKTVTGIVQNEKKEPMPFVSITIKGTSKGVKSNVLGEFKIVIPDTGNVSLMLSFIGFEKQELKITGLEPLIVTMVQESKSLNEVVVVGYGSATKKELTGATSKVGGEDIEKLNLSRMDQALQGQVSGVNISTNSGSPGGAANIRIRGLSTFGDNDPLILVDGVVYDSEGLNALNPSDIKSINVLKDATAGIYGVRAANGVILVETKQGRLNAKPKVELTSYYGVQSTSRKLDLLNATEYAIIKNEMFAFGGQDMPFNNTALGVGTNWQDSVFKNAPVQSHNLSMSGGTANTRYSLGLGYFSQDGIVGGPKSHFSRYNARLNLSTDLSKKLKLNSVFLFSNDYRNTLPENGIGSVLYNTINAFPNEPIRMPDGSYSYLEEVSDIINPLAQIANQYNWSWADKFVGKEELVYEFNENLSFTNRYNYNYAQVQSKVFSPLAWFGP
ncbi:MAG TPA: TonB-dependent receptor, partial [Crocinitomicaceae bacterium]|nr:TonB-dependent receptor [Crocinitomicaceae bacterium]